MQPGFIGVRLACLVNASVTGCPDNTIYAFGGFDQFTDEGTSVFCQCLSMRINLFSMLMMILVYNHVLRLDLQTFTWTLVDNFGDIPSVRMGMVILSLHICTRANVLV